jgi:hypothetical protein
LALAGCSGTSADSGREQAADSLAVASVETTHSRKADGPDANLSKPADANHPLAPAIQWAKEIKAGIERNVRDYTATLMKRERSSGNAENLIKAKIRHKPLSIYVAQLAPEKKKGEEAIYIDGQNDGKLWGHTTGILGKMVGTVSLKPDDSWAMKGQHYPMTEIGILNLCKRLIAVGEEDMQHGECEVKFDRRVDLNGRECTCVEVTHPAPRKHFRFHIAKIFVDNELKVPVRYAAYDWPKDGGEPELIEEYEYRDLKLNVGLTDSDFDVKNPEYQFP